MSRSGSRRRLRNRVWFVKYGTAAEAPCCWCGKLLTFNEATLEHLKELGAGGSFRTMSNLDISCYECNTSRSRALSHYLSVIQHREFFWKSYESYRLFRVMRLPGGVDFFQISRGRQVRAEIQL